MFHLPAGLKHQPLQNHGWLAGKVLASSLRAKPPARRSCRCKSPPPPPIYQTLSEANKYDGLTHFIIQILVDPQALIKQQPSFSFCLDYYFLYGKITERFSGIPRVLTYLWGTSPELQSLDE